MVNVQVKNAAFYNDGPLEALMRAYMWTYKNALVEFDEGDSDLATCRCFYVAFWGDILQIIFL